MRLLDGPIVLVMAVGERLGAKQTCPPQSWARREPVILSSLLAAGITMGLDVVGAALAAQK